MLHNAFETLLDNNATTDFMSTSQLDQQRMFLIQI